MFCSPFRVAQKNGMNMTQYDVVIVGGGPAGMMAALFARRTGKSVVILEKMQKLGKKLLITGAGRCNLSNRTLNSSFYKSEARPLVESVFRKFDGATILKYFKELGLHVYADETGRLFPVTNQAASVLKVLELELARVKVSVECGFTVSEINPVGEDRRSGDSDSLYFEVVSSGGLSVRGKAIILCGGGKSYPALGADGNAYGLAKKFGHSTVEPVPSTVPLIVKDPWCHFLQGQKIRAKVRVLEGREVLREADGDLLFTQYGLSGTAILDVSDPVSIALNREKKKEMILEMDLLSFLSEDELRSEIKKRVRRGIPSGNLLEGLLPHKFSKLLAREADVLTGNVSGASLDLLVAQIKRKKFRVLGTRGWNEAEFTAGGIPSSEVTEELGSKFQRGLAFAGEIVDVQASRGGYQLAWAWASGAVAGSAA